MSIGSRLVAEASSLLAAGSTGKQHSRTNVSVAAPKIVDRDSGPMLAARRLQQPGVSLAPESGHLTGAGITVLELVLAGRGCLT